MPVKKTVTKKPAVKRAKRPAINVDPERRKAYDKKRIFLTKTEKKIDEMIDAARLEKDNLLKIQREREKVEKKLKEREDLLLRAPTPKDQVKLLQAMFADSQFEPIQELIDIAKVKTGARALSPKDRAGILIKLAEYTTPKPKTVDTQRDAEMNIEINLVSYDDVTQKDLKAPVEQPKDSEYEAFMLDEDKNA